LFAFKTNAFVAGKIIIFFLQDMFYKTFMKKKLNHTCLFAFELFYKRFEFLQNVILQLFGKGKTQGHHKQCLESTWPARARVNHRWQIL